jgi:hypothetical protein
MAQGSAKRIIPAMAVLPLLLCGLASLGIPAGVLPAVAQAPAALSEAQDVNGVPGVVAEITQCKREDGMLSRAYRVA